MGRQSRLRESAQGDKWSFCLTAGKIWPANQERRRKTFFTADYIEPMELDLPLYAVQRLADGTWLVRSLMGDPLWPAVDVVAVVGAQTDYPPRPAKRGSRGRVCSGHFIDEGQRPSHFPRCDQQHDRGYEHQTHQTQETE